MGRNKNLIFAFNLWSATVSRGYMFWDNFNCPDNNSGF